MCCFYLEPFVTGSEPVELMLQIYNYICLEAAKARAGITGRNGPKGYICLQYISTYSLLVCISLPGDAPGAEPEEQRGGLPGGQSLMLITNFFKIAMRTLAILALHHQHLKVLTFRSLVSSVVVGAGLRPISWHVHGIADSSADSLCGEQVASQSEETSVPVIGVFRCLLDRRGHRSCGRSIRCQAPSKALFRSDEIEPRTPVV